MTTRHNAIIWIDGREAKVFYLKEIDFDHMVLDPHNPTCHIRQTAPSIRGGEAPLEDAFLKRVAEAVAEARGILITGPASEKSELVTHITRNHPAISRRIVGVETIENPSDGALVAVARICFKAEDRLDPKI